MPDLDGITIGAPRRDGAELSFTVSVSADCPFFDGHFPGRPVLPAIGQLAIVARLAREPLGPDAVLAGIERLRFRQAIGPGDELRFVLTVSDPPRRVKVSVLRGTEPVSEGTFVWRSAAERDA